MKQNNNPLSLKIRNIFRVPGLILLVSALAAAVPQKAFSPETVAAAISADADSSSETSESSSESSVRQTLEKFADTLDTLYGKTYTGYLWDDKKEKYKDRNGYDTSEIPASNAAYRIEDYDQDGNEELLVVSVNDNSALKLTMYEVEEGDLVFPADTFDAAAEQNDREFYVYAGETRGGYSRVFTYENGGPCIGLESLGFGIMADGRRRIILTVKYEDGKFNKAGEPYIDTSSAPLSNMSDDLERKVRAEIESYGTHPLLDKDVIRIHNGYPLDRYLPDVHEIMRSETIDTLDRDQYYEWKKKENPDKLEASSIHFAEMNELYSTEIKERFSKSMFSHLEKELSFSDEADNYGTVTWTSELTAFGKDGNLYQTGYNYVNPGEEARKEEIEFKNNKLKFTFWETRKKIYLIPEMKEEERAVLLEKGTLPKNAVLVYTDSEKPDALEPYAAGYHHSIKKYTGEIVSHKDIMIYKAYYIPKEKQEERNCITMIWKKDTGLIGYESSRPPVGVELIRIWDGKYVRVEDDGLVVD